MANPKALALAIDGIDAQAESVRIRRELATEDVQAKRHRLACAETTDAAWTLTNALRSILPASKQYERARAAFEATKRPGRDLPLPIPILPGTDLSTLRNVLTTLLKQHDARKRLYTHGLGVFRSAGYNVDPFLADISDGAGAIDSDRGFRVPDFGRLFTEEAS